MFMQGFKMIRLHASYLKNAADAHSQLKWGPLLIEISPPILILNVSSDLILAWSHSLSSSFMSARQRLRKKPMS